MRPYLVEQPNDSLRGSIASVMEIPYSGVPAFDMLDKENTWLQQINEWAAERFASRWVCAVLLQDADGNPSPNGIWQPPGWYIEAAETEDGELTVFQVCSGSVVMHEPFQGRKAKVQAKARLWLVVLDPARAFASIA